MNLALQSDHVAPELNFCPAEMIQTHTDGAEQSFEQELTKPQRSIPPEKLDWNTIRSQKCELVFEVIAGCPYAYDKSDEDHAAYTLCLIRQLVHRLVPWHRLHIGTSAAPFA
jgi:hypothetical protein